MSTPKWKPPVDDGTEIRGIPNDELRRILADSTKGEVMPEDLNLVDLHAGVKLGTNCAACATYFRRLADAFAECSKPTTEHKGTGGKAEGIMGLLIFCISLCRATGASDADIRSILDYALENVHQHGKFIEELIDEDRKRRGGDAS